MDRKLAKRRIYVAAIVWGPSAWEWAVSPFLAEIGPHDHISRAEAPRWRRVRK
jgi:hypothetical protein